MLSSDTVSGDVFSSGTTSGGVFSSGATSSGVFSSGSACPSIWIAVLSSLFFRGRTGSTSDLDSTETDGDENACVIENPGKTVASTHDDDAGCDSGISEEEEESGCGCDWVTEIMAKRIAIGSGVMMFVGVKSG